jgi:hypothetical protein
MIWADEKERITCHFKNVRISCKEGYESLPLVVAGNFDKIVFENCVIEGYTEPTILVGASGGEVEVINSTPIKVKRTTFAACIEAHPHAVPAEVIDRLKAEGK